MLNIKNSVKTRYRPSAESRNRRYEDVENCWSKIDEPGAPNPIEKRRLRAVARAGTKLGKNRRGVTVE